MPQATFTADTRPLARGMDEAVQKIKKVKQASDETGRALKFSANQFDGSKIEGQALRVARAIEKIGGAHKLTQAEALRASRNIDELLNKYRAMGVQAPAAIQKLSRELRQVQQEAVRLNRSMSSFGGGGLGGTLLTGLGIGSGAAAGIAAIGQLRQGLAEVFDESRRIAQLQAPFDRYSGGAEAAATKLEKLRVATLGLVSTADLMQASNQASALGLDRMGLQFDEVARVATILGRAVGQDATTAVSDLTNGLAKGSAEVLNNLGVIIRAEDAYKKYADRLGKTKDELSDVERQTAVAVIGFEQATAKAAEAGETMLTAWDRLGQIGTTLLAIGSDAGKSAGEWQPLIDALKDVNHYLELIRKHGTQGVAATARAATGGLTDWLIESGQGMRAAGDAQLRRGNPLGLLAIAPGLLYQGAGLGLAGLGSYNPVLLPPDAPGGLPRGAAGGPLPLPPGALPPYVKPPSAAEQAKADREAKAAAKRIEAERERARKEAEAAAKRFVEGVTRDMNTVFGITDTYRTRVNFSPSNLFSATPQMIGGSFNPFDTPERQRAALVAAGHRTSIWNTPDMLGGIAGAIDVDLSAGFPKTKDAARDLSLQLGEVAEAFANLAQVAGDAMPGFSRAIGISVASGAAAQTLIAQVGGLFKEGSAGAKFFGGTGGRLLGGGLAGFGAGLAMGSQTTSVGKGALGGAASGAAAGMAFGPMGALVGAGIGAIGGWIGSKNAQKKAFDEKDANMAAILDQFGSLNNLLDTVGELGMNQKSFLDGWFGDPKAFKQQTDALNKALKEEAAAVDKLGKSLQSTAQSQAVMTREQMKSLQATRAGGPGAEQAVAFLQQQQEMAAGGAVRAAQAIIRRGQLTEDERRAAVEGIEDEEAQRAAIEAAAAAKRAQTAEQFAAGGRGAGAALLASYAAMRAEGISATDILRGDVGQSLQGLREMGIGGAGIERLGSMADIVTGEQTGTHVEIAEGLGQALAGLTNSGLMTQELFADLTAGITESQAALDALGKGGEQSFAVLQQPLQAIWEAQQQFGYEVDEATQALLDQALAAGAIGEKFRPSTDRMVDAIERMASSFDTFLADLPKKMADAVGGMQGALNKLRTPNLDMPAGGGGGGGSEPENSFAGGTGGLRSFDPQGEWALLHGREAVLTEGQYSMLTAMAGRRVASQAMTALPGPLYVEVVSVMDSRKVGRGVAEVQPTINRLYAGGA